MNLCALLVALAVLDGCALISGKPAATEVAQGQRFSTSNAEYDAFFASVHRLQLEMARAPGELATARNHLTRATVLAKDVGSSALAAQTKLELDRLAKRGISVRVELREATPETAAQARAVLTPATKPPAAEAELVRELETGVTGMLRLSASMRGARSQLGSLCERAERLEQGLDAAYRDASRSERSRVLDNLRDAERVLALMLARVEQVGKPASEFVEAFAEATASRKPPQIHEPEPAPVEEPEREIKPAPEPARAPVRSAPAPAKKGAEPATRSEFEP